jgi:hypothetical protein
MAQNLITARRAARPKYAHSPVNDGAIACSGSRRLHLALTGFEAPVRLIDDVDAALAAHDAIIAMPAAQRFQRITDFHG